MAMLERLLDLFLKPYAQSDIRVRKKAKLLVPTALSIGILSVVLSSFMAATGALSVAVMLGMLAVFSTIVLILTAKGKYQLAASLLLYGLFVVMFGAIKFDEYKTIYECYVFGTLGLFLIITSALLAISRILVYVLSGLNVLAIVSLYILDALPLDGGTVTPLALQSLGTSLLLVVIGGVFAAITVRLQRTLVDESVSVATKAASHYESTMSAFQRVQQAATETGQKLALAGRTLAMAAAEMSSIAREEADGIASLDKTLMQSVASDKTVADGQERVGKALSEYSSKVLAASAAISQMIKSLREIAAAAGERKSGVDALGALAKDGDQRVLEITQSIEGIVKAAARMDEMNTLIGDVADRTNLLGMNASIEAAHAGSAGRGFAVVAGEIRSLSVEASNSSRVIGSLITDTRKAVNQAAQSGSQTGAFLKRISEEIEALAQTLAQLLVHLNEASAGTNEISQTINGFKDLALSASQAAEEATSAMKTSYNRSAQARTVAASLRSSAERLSSACGQVLAQAEEIQRLGAENSQRMAELRKSLADPV